MQRRKLILAAAVCGAIIGVLATMLRGRTSLNIPALAFDNTPFSHWQLVCGCLPWVLFSLYWEITAKNAAVAASSESPVSRGFHVALANLAIVLEMAPVRGLGCFLPASYLIVAAGAIVECMGLFLAIWARQCLGRNWSGEISIKVEHQLIRSGPYKQVRHPIYTGLLTMYVGGVLVSGRWLAIIGLGVAAYAYRRKIGLEETNLGVAFGFDYDTYRRDTWALVPGLF